MSVRIVRDSVAGVRALFAKTFEIFTGGFGWSAQALDNHTEGIVLPAGSLLTVSESARVARPVKRGRTTTLTGSAATGVNVQKGHLFEVGDNIHFIGGNPTAGAITAIYEHEDSDRLSISPGLLLAESYGNRAIGAGVYEGTGNTLVGTANAISAYPTTIEEGASVTALRRGTVYANRVPPVGTHDQLPSVIEFSDSQ